jgi:hypothetical protein
MVGTAQVRLCPPYEFSNGLIRSRNLAIPRRDAPEFCSSHSPRKIRGRRECRALDAPAASRAK